MQKEMTGVKITDSLIQSLSCKRQFSDFTSTINSLSFSHDDKWLLASSNNEKVAVYDIETGK